MGGTAAAAFKDWIKTFDDGFTFKGDRQKGLKGVFKLRRLKTSSKLRRFYPRDENLSKSAPLAISLVKIAEIHFAPGELISLTKKINMKWILQFNFE